MSIVLWVKSKFCEIEIFPEINDKLLNHTMLLKSGSKPKEFFLLKVTVPILAFFHGSIGYRRVDH